MIRIAAHCYAAAITSLSDANRSLPTTEPQDIVSGLILYRFPLYSTLKTVETVGFSSTIPKILIFGIVEIFGN